MGKMSELHAESAPERAQAAENEVEYLRMVVRDLLDFIEDLSTRRISDIESDIESDTVSIKVKAKELVALHRIQVGR